MKIKNEMLDETNVAGPSSQTSSGLYRNLSLIPEPDKVRVFLKQFSFIIIEMLKLD